MVDKSTITSINLAIGDEITTNLEEESKMKDAQWNELIVLFFIHYFIYIIFLCVCVFRAAKGAAVYLV